jgi:hypothetical protein
MYDAERSANRRHPVAQAAAQTARTRQPRLEADPCVGGHIGSWPPRAFGGFPRRPENAPLWIEAIRHPPFYHLPVAPHSINVMEIQPFATRLRRAKVRRAEGGSAPPGQCPIFIGGKGAAGTVRGYALRIGKHRVGIGSESTYGDGPGQRRWRLAKRLRATSPSRMGSPAGDGGGSFLTLVLSAPSPVSGAIADSSGSLPHDGAVDRDRELARHARFYRGDHR